MRAGRLLGALTVAAFAALVLLPPAPALAGGGDDALPPELRAWVDDHGPVRVGWFDGAAPVSIWEDGELVGGYATELWDLAALRLGFDVEHVLLPDIPAVVAALEAGEIDVAGAHGDRPDLLAFAGSTQPSAWERISFVAPTGLAVPASDLAGVTVTTVGGSPLEQQLLAEYPDAVYVPYPTIPEGLQAVVDGEVELYFGPLAVVGYALNQQGLELSPVGPAVTVIPVSGWAVAGSEALALARVARDSISPAELALVHVRWTGFDLGNPDRGLPGWAVPALVTAFGAVVLLAAFAWLLRRRVAAATVELRRLNDELERRVTARTEDLSETTRRLRRSNLALKRFSTTAAHDVKGPITAIGGLASVLETVELSADEQRDVVSRIRAAAVRLGRMVDAMLADAVTMGVGRSAITGPMFRAWVEEVVGPELDVVGGRLEVVVPDGPIDADVEVLRRSAVNLVGNAAKYAVNEQDGSVVRVTLERDGDVWRLAVDDNGPGVPQPLWSEVFERGSRLVHDERGFGLGLAAVRDLVQGVGGAISIGDGPLGGARFTVTLPRTAAVAPAPSDGSEAEAQRLS